MSTCFCVQGRWLFVKEMAEADNLDKSQYYNLPIAPSPLPAPGIVNKPVTTREHV